MSDRLEYNALDGSAARGVVWSPGPLPQTFWVLPESGASSAVVVRAPARPGKPYCEVAWDFYEHVVDRHGSAVKQRGQVVKSPGLLATDPSYRESCVQATRLAMAHAPRMSAKLWKAAAAPLMIGYDIESPQSAGR